ncbi:MAG: leucine-rich repeat domain-containing protein [Prevotella sp.]|nr:leucine-rich repeat domain-containing protein [Prevotella sp.]
MEYQTDSSSLILLFSKSGTFYTDENGMVVDFEPSKDNPFIETKVDEPMAYDGFVVKKSIVHLVVPEGVKGFADDFFRGIEVKERFTLPNRLLYIGNSCHDPNSYGCVFAECRLPEVRIPNTVIELGAFAFGDSHIDYLRIPSSIRSPYLRQFKDCSISTLSLPVEWRECVSLDEHGRLKLSGVLNTTNDGYLIWPSTSVGKLEFYE